ncbi:response regulator [Brevibacillus dissolubilis]|uniref:response regulator n=1 Tax=Brevibacillus dissolubilis TaxID=1844116 RepID=UPI001116CB7B|nr:response regulator transcription factor [Brevibacillus dissolubilis]
MTSYRVLIVDDHPLARSATRSMLADDPNFIVVGEADNGEEGVRLCEVFQPDVVLMDINMPGCNGLDATKRIKHLYPQIKVVILSVSDDVADLFTAVQFGAQGYLLKNMQPKEWLAYLRSLLTEDATVSREMAGRLFHQFRPASAKTDEPSPSILTPRETEILQYVALGETNRQIANHLVITEHTVKNHIKNLLEKLYLENRVQLAAYAHRHGIKREQE